MVKAIPPRWSNPVSVEAMRAGDGADFIRFMHQRGRVTKTSIGGKAKTRLKMRPWQQKEMFRLLARDPELGIRLHRAGLLGVARKNGKSAKGSGLSLWTADRCDPGGEIYICASDREQAGIVGGVAKAMVRMDPYLSRRFRTLKNEIVIEKDDIVIKIMSSEAYTKDGYNPILVVFDEVHAQPNAELWDAMALGMGSRIDPLMIGITTAGKRFDRLGRDTLCYGLYEYGKQVANGEIDDPTFYFSWWEPKKGSKANHLSKRTWAEANPGIDDLVSSVDLKSVSRRTDEAVFKTKRCNMWVSQSVAAIPEDAFESLGKRRGGKQKIELGGGRRKVPADLLADSVQFLDGSWSGDSTGIVGCTRDGHLFVTVHHERNQFDSPHWRVPVNDVKQDIRTMFDAGIRLLILDPFRWQQTAVDLAEEGYPVVEWPTNSLPRIMPAWKDYYAAVMDKELTHDGNRALVRHHDNMVLKIDTKGTRPTKESPTSVRHIDLAICSIGAYANRNVEMETETVRKPWVLTT